MEKLVPETKIWKTCFLRYNAHNVKSPLQIFLQNSGYDNTTT